MWGGAHSDFLSVELIDQSVEFVKFNNFILSHCNSTFSISLDNLLHLTNNLKIKLKTRKYWFLKIYQSSVGHLIYIYIYIYIICVCVCVWLFTHASNPWWWLMKGPKALGTILENSSTNSNQKPRHLSGNSKGS